jgi:hypothetical protein
MCLQNRVRKQIFAAIRGEKSGVGVAVTGSANHKLNLKIVLCQ